MPSLVRASVRRAIAAVAGAATLAAGVWAAGCGHRPHAGQPANRPVSAAGIDLNDHPTNPFAGPPRKATVLVFLTTDCPIGNRYAPELRRISGEYAARGVAFWLVYPEADLAAETIRKHVRNYDLPSQLVRDPAHDLVRVARATTMPEAAVFTANGQLVYHGRIDNWYADYGRARPAPTERDLRAALDAVLAGNEPDHAFAPAIGCAIPSLHTGLAPMSNVEP